MTLYPQNRKKYIIFCSEKLFFSINKGHFQAHRDLKVALGLSTLSITDIFRFPTLAALAAHVDGLTGAVAAPEPEPTANRSVRSETMSKRRLMRAGRSRARG